MICFFTRIFRHIFWAFSEYMNYKNIFDWKYIFVFNCSYIQVRRNNLWGISFFKLSKFTIDFQWCLFWKVSIASRQAWLKKNYVEAIRISSICKTFQELLVPIPLATVRTVPPTSLCKPFPTKPILHWAFEILYLPRNGVVIDDKPAT